MGGGSSKNKASRKPSSAPATAAAAKSGVQILQTVSPPTKDTDFLFRGVKLSVYKAIVENGVQVVDERGKVVKSYAFEKNWSTEDLCQKVLIPACEKDQCLFANLLVDKSMLATKEYAGVFISQARMCNFAQLVRALCQTFPPDTFIWTDIFQVNQYTFRKISADKRNTWIAEGLHKAIASFDNRAVFFNAWDRPIVLERAWCAWEFYGCALNNKPMDIILEKDEETRFVKEALLGDVTSIFKNLSSMNIKNAACKSEVDREMIMEQIATKVGFARVNELVLDRLREWFIESGKKHLSDVKGKGKDEGQLLKNIGLVLMDFGKYAEAMSFLDQAQSIMQKAAGSTSVEMGTILNNKALCYLAMGKSREALTESEKAYGILKAIDNKHPRVAIALTNMAAALTKLSPPDLGKAKHHYEEASELFKLNKDEQSCATSLSNMGEILLDEGKLDEAVAKLQEANSYFKKTSQSEHIWAAPILSNLGVAFKRQGNIDEAISTFKNVLEIQRHVLGENHPSVAVTLTDLAGCYDSKSEHEREKECLDKALAIGKSAGNESRDVAIYTSNLANWYDARGRKEEALRTAKEAALLFEKVFGADDDRTKSIKEAWQL